MCCVLGTVCMSMDWHNFWGLRDFSASPGQDSGCSLHMSRSRILAEVFFRGVPLLATYKTHFHRALSVSGINETFTLMVRETCWSVTVIKLMSLKLSFRPLRGMSAAFSRKLTLTSSASTTAATPGDRIKAVCSATQLPVPSRGTHG